MSEIFCFFLLKEAIKLEMCKRLKFMHWQNGGEFKIATVSEY